MEFDIHVGNCCSLTTNEICDSSIKFIEAQISTIKYNGRAAIACLLYGFLATNRNSIPKSLLEPDYYKYEIIPNIIADSGAEIPGGSVLIFRKALPIDPDNTITVREISRNEFWDGVIREFNTELKDPVDKCNRFLNAVRIDGTSIEVAPSIRNTKGDNV